MNKRYLSKEEWLEENYFMELDRSDEEKEEDYQRYIEQAVIMDIMYPNGRDDDMW